MGMGLLFGLLQHDILWETLTARQHMLFYGRLKNLDPNVLKMAVVDGLKEVTFHMCMHST
jgi:ABC-type multidrug transport system ATPase subunit